MNQDRRGSTGNPDAQAKRLLHALGRSRWRGMEARAWLASVDKRWLAGVMLAFAPVVGLAALGAYLLLSTTPGRGHQNPQAVVETTLVLSTDPAAPAAPIAPDLATNLQSDSSTLVPSPPASSTPVAPDVETVEDTSIGAAPGETPATGAGEAAAAPASPLTAAATNAATGQDVDDAKRLAMAGDDVWPGESDPEQEVPATEDDAVTPSPIEPPVVTHSLEGQDQCSSCHTIGGSEADSSDGTLLSSSHEGRLDSICLGCHRADAAEPTATPTATPTAAAGPPSPPHSLQGRDECTMCHSVGDSGVGSPGGTGLPDSHEGRDSSVCLSCHTADTNTPTPTATAGTVTPTVTGAPPSPPHSLQGRDQCTMCHTVGAPGVGSPGGTGLPASHEGRDSSVCLSCHSAGSQPTATPTPTLPPGVTPTATPPSTGGPPSPPHTLVGRDQCTMCHTVGAPGAGSPGGTGLPASHAGRDSSVCLTCHSAGKQPTATPAPTLPPGVTPTATPTSKGGPPSPPHTLVGRDQCTMCHTVGAPGAGVTGGTGLPASHEGRDSSVCLSCHGSGNPAPTATPTAPAGAAPTATSPAGTAPTATPPGSSGPPSPPHTLVGRDQCTMCHAVGDPGVGSPGGTGLPASHEGRDSSVCLSCHGSGNPAPTATPTPTPTSPPGSAPTAAPTVAVPTATPPVSAGPPPPPHTLQGRDQCTMCHAVGDPGVGSPGGTGLPASHEGRDSSVCLSCHGSGSPAPTATPTPTPTSPPGSAPTATPPAPAPTATPTVAVPTATPPPAAGPPNLPHTTVGRDQCTGCHTVGGPGVGAPGGTGLPSSHQGRTSSTCLGCHSTGDTLPAGPTSTATPAPTAPAATSPTPKPTVAVPTATPTAGKQAPRIDHKVQGREQCTQCHAVEGSKTPSVGERMPKDHQGRTSDMCLGCHRP